MRIVNSLLCIILSCIVLGCKETKQTSLPLGNQTSLTNYDIDSVFYNIDVKGDEKKEIFLITKEISVGDSLFGKYNYDNEQKAISYSKRKGLNSYNDINIIYTILSCENNIYEIICKVINNAFVITYPFLKQGEFNTLDVVARKNFIHEGSKFLRIMEVSDSNLETKSINLVFKNGKWKPFSKEMINYRKGLKSSYKGYCIDTLKINFEIDTINFDYIFLSDSNFSCN